MGDVEREPVLDVPPVPSWYPSALVEAPCEPAQFSFGLPSPWGRLRGWDYTAALSPIWWSTVKKNAWGDWPQKVEQVSVVTHTRRAVVLDLDERWTVHLYPFPTGKEVSTLALYSPWAEVLTKAPLLMPVAGLHGDDGDMVAVFPKHTCVSSASLVGQADALAEGLGRLHQTLVPHATPNTERRWNDRLKAMEDGLKSTTLWRASHTKHVVGLPSVEVNLDAVLEGKEGLHFVPQPRSVVDRLLAPAERLPGVAMVARLEQRLALNGAFEGHQGREAFYERWGSLLPPAWTSRASVSTVNGGVWIWRYEAILLMLAEARAHGLTEQAAQCDRWLLDVSRIQARLGELRTVHAVRKGALSAALSAALIGSGPLQLPFTAGALGVGVVAHVLHRNRIPPPY